MHLFWIGFGSGACAVTAALLIAGWAIWIHGSRWIIGGI